MSEGNCYFIAETSKYIYKAAHVVFANLSRRLSRLVSRFRVLKTKRDEKQASKAFLDDRTRSSALALVSYLMNGAQLHRQLSFRRLWILISRLFIFSAPAKCVRDSLHSSKANINCRGLDASSSRSKDLRARRVAEFSAQALAFTF